MLLLGMSFVGVVCQLLKGYNHTLSFVKIKGVFILDTSWAEPHASISIG
jgi:hypothetical protein